MKKSLLVLIFFSSYSFSGVPVIDNANLSQSVMDYVATVAEFTEQAARWEETIKQYQNQLNTMTDQLAAQTGIRDMTKIFSDLQSIHKNISEFKMPNAETIISKGEEFIDRKTAEYMRTNLVYDRCKQRNIRLRNLCKTEQLTSATAQVQIEAVQNELSEYLKELGRVQDKARSSIDAKESLDINNMAQVNLAKINLIKTKLEISKMNFEIAQKLREEQERQIQSERNRNIDGIFPNY